MPLPDALTPLRCPLCGSQLQASSGRPGATLVSTGCGAVYEPIGGVYDLWSPGRDLPILDVFGTPYGWAYDAAVTNRWLAPLAGWISWGADIEDLYRRMREGLKCAPGQRVLDVPVGGGTTFAKGASALKGVLIGIDISWAMLARAAARRRATGLDDRVLLARGDATHLPVRDAGVDRVLSFMGLHVIPDHAAMLAECRRVLRPGGELSGCTLVSQAPAPWSMNVRLARLAGFFTPPEPDRLELLAREAGFRRWEQRQTGALAYFRGQ